MSSERFLIITRCAWLDCGQRSALYPLACLPIGVLREEKLHRRVDRVERDDERAHRGLHRGRVALGGVDPELGRLLELLLLGRGTVEGREGSCHGERGYPPLSRRAL